MAKKNIEEGIVKEATVLETDNAKVADSAPVTPKFSLPNEKVHVKPILRNGSWLPQGHSGHFMYDNTQLGIQVPIDRNTGKLKNPLTPEEQEWFETSSGLDLKKGDLNPYKKADNFWSDYMIRIHKTDSIVKDDTVLMTLDLSKPLDYLSYKVLLINSQRDGGLVAPSWAERESSGTYRIALVREGQQHSDKLKKAEKMELVYKYLSKIDSSAEAMFDFLTVYYLENAKGKRPSQDSSKSFYKSEIQDLIDEDLNGVVEIIKDAANYEYKLLVHRGLKIGALKIVGGNRIETIEGAPVGNSLQQAVQWFKDDRHQDEYLRLKNQIELSK